MNINHLHLKVRSVERARAFYERFFGLRDLVWRGDMLFMSDVAGMDLALAPGETVEPMPSWFHFGFRLASAGEVRALHAVMADAAVAITEPLTTDGELTFFRCGDPDGYSIEVYLEPRPA
jgi:catechol 2,3-dioxygenase-like lactoylglutathione lyase family enzyme